MQGFSQSPTLHQPAKIKTTINKAKKPILSKDRFVRVEDIRGFNPEALSPLPQPRIARHDFDWWIRCSSGTMINFSACYESFLNINAMYKKDHACWNCSLGKNYREMSSEGAFVVSRFDTLLQ